MLAGSDWQEQDLVFPNPTGGIRTGTAATRNFQGRLVRRGLPEIRWHALRRPCSALLQDQGVPITVVRDILGHSILQVDEGYAYVMPAALLDAMDRLDGALEPEVNWGTIGVRGQIADRNLCPSGSIWPQSLAPPAGIEPAAHGLEVRCSIP